MNRRVFLQQSTALAASAIAAPRSFAASSSAGYYQIASAVLPRHSKAEDVFPVLERYKQRGYSGIWIENDYLSWRWSGDPDPDIGGNWKLFNIFDFTFGSQKSLYQDYLFSLCEKCTALGLDFFGSFWMPKLNAEMKAYLATHCPEAFGSRLYHGKPAPTLCSCKDSAGLDFLQQMVISYLKLSPAIRGLKVATLDNYAFICDETCPHAHGSGRKEHVGNLYASIDRGMQRAQSKARLFVYEWFWEHGYLEQVQSQIQRPFDLICKMSAGSTQQIETVIPGAPLFDASNVVIQEGSYFRADAAQLGIQHMVDMPAMGSGIDNFFLGSPPIPGRIHRRMQLHRSLGCDKFVEFDCGSHWNDSNELAFEIFNRTPSIAQSALLENVAARIYTKQDARAMALEAWSAFDTGYGFLPIGLGDTKCEEFSGRFGMGWTMCIATPLVLNAFGDEDQQHRIHWLSPYNFFNSSLVDRLQAHFQQVSASWQHAARLLAAASVLEDRSAASEHEAVAAEGHLLAVTSALNWCNACRYARNPTHHSSFADLLPLEMQITERFQRLSRQHDWLWNHICWHPHRTPMSQKDLGFEGLSTHDTFQAKLEIMRVVIKS